MTRWSMMVCIALDLTGFMITPKDGRAEKWPLNQRTAITPSWCASVAEQEREVRRSRRGAIAANIAKLPDLLKQR